MPSASTTSPRAYFSLPFSASMPCLTSLSAARKGPVVSTLMPRNRSGLLLDPTLEGQRSHALRTKRFGVINMPASLHGATQVQA